MYREKVSTDRKVNEDKNSVFTLLVIEGFAFLFWNANKKPHSPKLGTQTLAGFTFKKTLFKVEKIELKTVGVSIGLVA